MLSLSFRRVLTLILLNLCTIMVTACQDDPSSFAGYRLTHLAVQGQLPPELTRLEELAYHTQEPYLTPIALSLPGFQPGGAVAIQGRYYLYTDSQNHLCRALRSHPAQSESLFEAPFLDNSKMAADPKVTCQQYADRFHCRFEQTPTTTYLRVYGGQDRMDMFYRVAGDHIDYLRGMTVTEFTPDCRFGYSFTTPPGTLFYWSDDVHIPLLPIYLENEPDILYGWQGYNIANQEMACRPSHDFYYQHGLLYLLGLDLRSDADHSKIYQADIQSGHTAPVMTHPADSFCLTTDERLYFRDYSALYQTTLADPEQAELITDKLPVDWTDERTYGDNVWSLPFIQPYTVNGNHLYYVTEDLRLHRDQERTPLFSGAKVRSLKTEGAYTLILLTQSARQPLSLAVFDQQGRLLFQETAPVGCYQLSRGRLFYTSGDQLYVVSLQKSY